MPGGSLSGVKAGRAFIVIDAIDKTGPIMKSIGTRLRQWGSQINQFANNLMRSMAVMLAPVALSGRVFYDFDDAMRRVQARSRATADEIERLRNQARQLGRDTSSTATQVANLMAVLAQKGFTPSQIEQMTPHIRNLAQAAGAGTQEDTTVAAQAVTQVLKSFQMDASQTQMVVDLLTAAVNNSNFSLAEMVNSLSEAGTIAGSFGMDLRQTIATLALMRDLNIAAQKAGVAFKVMETRLAKSSGREQFNRDLQRMTGQTIEFVDASGNLRPLPLILFEISQAIRSLGTANELEMLGELFGTRGILGAGAFRGKIQDFEKFMTIFSNLDDNAAKTARTMDSGFGGSVRRIWSMVTDLGIAIAESLEPSLKETEITVKLVTRAVTAWVQSNGQVIASIVKWVLAITAAAIALKVLGVALMMAGQLLQFFGSIVSGFTFVFALLVRGFLILGNVILLFAGKLMLAGGALAALGPLIVMAFAGVLVAVVAMVTSIIGYITNFVGQVIGAISNLGSSISGTFEKVKELIEKGDMETAAQIAALSIEIAFREAFQKIIEGWNVMIEKMKLRATDFALRFSTPGIIKKEGDPAINKALEALESGFVPWHLQSRDKKIKQLKDELEALQNAPAAPEGEKKPPQPWQLQMAGFGGMPGFGGGIATAMVAMESRQRETVLEISKLRGKGLEKGIDKLNMTNDRQLVELQNINANLEDGSDVQILGD